MLIISIRLLRLYKYIRVNWHLIWESRSINAIKMIPHMTKLKIINLFAQVLQDKNGFRIFVKLNYLVTQMIR